MLKRAKRVLKSCISGNNLSIEMETPIVTDNAQPVNALRAPLSVHNSPVMQPADNTATDSDSKANSSNDEENNKLYISNFRIDCVPDEAKHLSIQLIELVYKNKENTGLFPLKKVSSASWKTDSLITVPLDINSLGVYVHGEGYYNIGYIQLEENILDGLRKKEESSLEFQETIITAEMLRMSIAFTLSTVYHGSQNPTPSNEIALLQQVIQLTPEGHSELPYWLGSIGIAFQIQFDCSEDITDISEAISFHQKAVQLTHEENPDLPSRLYNLGNSFQARFEHFEDISDISEAITSHQKAVQLTPDGHPDLPARLSNFGNAFHSRFERFGDISDISEALSSHQKAVQLTPEGHPDLPSRLNNLGISFQTRFERFGDKIDILEAISCKQKAAHLTPEGHPDLPLWLSNLGNSFLTQFECLGDINDISEALSSHQKAVQLTPEGHPDLPSRLNNLGISFQTRFERFGDNIDILQAISSYKKAVQLTPEGHSGLPARFNNLGISLQTQFDHFGNKVDILEAISSQQKAVHLTPEGHPDLPLWLSNLGNSLQMRFNHFGDITDISEAISSHQKAVQLTPEGHPDLPSRLNNLGISFQTRFERFGDIDDIDDAISSQQKAVQLTPEGHPDLLLWLNNLGLSFHTRFERLGDNKDISEAISCKQKAVQLTPEGHPDLPSRLNNLGISFQTRFDRFGDITDISEAILSMQKAIRLTPEGHSGLPARFNNLGISFQTRFERFQNTIDISEAILSHQKAVQLTAEEHHDIPLWLSNLGISFQTRFDHFGDITDISEAISHHRLAATSKIGSPFVHLTAAKYWAKLVHDHKPSQEIEAYKLIINLMSDVAGMEQTVELRHANITSMSRLASQAVTVAFSHGRPDLALEWLEQGRCLVWNQLNQLRTPSHNLQTKRPELSAKLQQVSTALADAGSRQRLSPFSAITNPKDILAKKVLLEDAANAHVKVAHEYNQILREIRAIPEFENFLRPRTASEILAHLPKAGPVILINIHENRCDAIALIYGRDEPLHIPLENLTYEKAEELRSQLSTCLSQCGLQKRDVDRGLRRPKAAKQIERILCTLWLDLVKPIFNALNFKSPQSQLRRIWWCATGPLASLPIHAAGIYRDSGTCVSDFAISSYIPNVRMLVDKIKDTAESQNNRLLLVSQAQANPHKFKIGDEEIIVTLSTISGVDEETSILKKLMADSNIGALRLAGNDATMSNVQKEIAKYRSIHLACHGTQDFRKPLQSGFYLLDGPLQLSEIMKQHNPSADLAFLSACSTSTGDKTLTEEAVHLAAGMLAVGYRSVVATMWSIKDNYGPEVAEDFYSELLKSGENGGHVRLDGAGAAYALHYATQCLRKKVGDNDSGLLTWLPYVHFGI